MKLSNKTKSILQLFLAATIILSLHLTGTSLAPGWVTWAISFPALVIITLTAAARVHAITGMTKRWFVRRIGMLLVAGGSVSMMLAPVLGYSNGFPSWRATCILWGFALAWLTTPNMVPWWKFINGDYKLKEGQQV